MALRINVLAAVLSGSGSPAVPSTGVFFDSSAGDSFIARMSYPSNAALTVSSNNIAFSSASALTLDVNLLDDTGSVMKHCLDNISIDAAYSLTSFPAVDVIGSETGCINDAGTIFAGEMKAHPALATLAYSRTITNSAIVVSDASGYAFSPGVIIQYATGFSQGAFKNIVTYASTTPRDLSATLTITATSRELPRLFNTAAIRFKQGIFTLTSLKIHAAYPNALYACVGDSITQSRLCTLYSDGFPQLLRATYPGNVIVAGAPVSTIADWLTNTYQVTFMKPKYAFIMLGTNDITLGTSLATMQTNFTTLVASFVAAGIIPVALAITPRGGAQAPAFNAWLAVQGWAFIDTYTPLLGTGTSLNAAYDSGDGLHPNTAGNLVLYNTIQAQIVAQGLT